MYLRGRCSRGRSGRPGTGLGARSATHATLRRTSSRGGRRRRLTSGRLSSRRFLAGRRRVLAHRSGGRGGRGRSRGAAHPTLPRRRGSGLSGGGRSGLHGVGRGGWTGCGSLVRGGGLGRRSSRSRSVRRRGRRRGRAGRPQRCRGTAHAALPGGDVRCGWRRRLFRLCRRNRLRLLRRSRVLGRSLFRPLGLSGRGRGLRHGRSGVLGGRRLGLCAQRGVAGHPSPCRRLSRVLLAAHGAIQSF